MLLLAVPGVELTASTTTVPALLSLQLDATLHFVLLYASDNVDRACGQVRDLREAWPGVRCLVLIESAQQEAAVRAAGADEVLVKGASARRLSEAIRRLRSRA